MGSANQNPPPHTSFRALAHMFMMPPYRRYSWECATTHTGGLGCAQSCWAAGKGGVCSPWESKSGKGRFENVLVWGYTSLLCGILRQCVMGACAV